MRLTPTAAVLFALGCAPPSDDQPHRRDHHNTADDIEADLSVEADDIDVLPEQEDGPQLCQSTTRYEIETVFGFNVDVQNFEAVSYFDLEGRALLTHTFTGAVGTPLSGVTTFIYDADGQLIEWISMDPSGAATSSGTMTYDANGFLVEKATESGWFTTFDQYEVDEVGNVLVHLQTLFGSTDRMTYAYDAENRQIEYEQDRDDDGQWDARSETTWTQPGSPDYEKATLCLFCSYAESTTWGTGDADTGERVTIVDHHNDGTNDIESTETYTDFGELEQLVSAEWSLGQLLGDYNGIWEYDDEERLVLLEYTSRRMPDYTTHYRQEVEWVCSDP